jgi:hypothetical protein
MDKKIVLILFLLVLSVILYTNKEDPLLLEIKRRYDILLQSTLPDSLKSIQENKAIITGKSDYENDGNIAFNVNKGYEIHICIDGRKINGAMYVFLHELAHITVEEYDHSEQFWANFKLLREHAKKIGIYTPEKESVYCGQTITDSL